MRPVKKNQTFVYIYAICIIMLIDGHSGNRIGILSSIFPYDSFFMPLFVFSSGYFYRKRPLQSIVLRKLKRLVVPYLIYDSIMVLFVSRITDLLFRTNWHRNISLKSIIRLVFDKPTTPINGPAWFVIMLFWVSISYAIVRTIFPLSKNHDYSLLFLFCIIGLISVHVCIHYTDSDDIKWFVIRFICRTLFYMQFYHIGYMFRNYFETFLKKRSRYLICSLCVAINLVLVLLYGSKINFYSTYYMKSFNFTLLPFVTSITGIAFYYEVASFFADAIGNNKIVSFIGRNTFTILQVHMLFVNVPNYYIYYAIRYGSQKYNDFPINEYINSIWVRYSPNSKLVGFFCGLIGSILVAYFLERISAIIKTAQ